MNVEFLFTLLDYGDIAFFAYSGGMLAARWRSALYSRESEKKLAAQPVWPESAPVFFFRRLLGHAGFYFGLLVVSGPCRVTPPVFFFRRLLAFLVFISDNLWLVFISDDFCGPGARLELAQKGPKVVRKKQPGQAKCCPK